MFSGGVLPTSPTSRITNRPSSPNVTPTTAYSYQYSTYSPTTLSHSVTSNNALPSSKCPNGDGIYPDLESGCTKFYQCLYTGTGNQIVQTFVCPDLTLYDAVIKSCNFAPSVKCGVSPYQISSVKPITFDSQVTQANVITSSNISPTCINGDGKTY